MASDTKSLCMICDAQSVFWGAKDGFVFHRCPSCGFIFTTSIPETTAPLYSQDYFQGATKGFGYVDYDRDKSPMRRTFERYLDEIERYASNKGRLLDVGAATGYFLELAAKHGWQTHGIEISEYAASVARAKGLAVRTGTLETVEVPQSSCDVVTLWDVIEHVPDPKAALRRIHSLLRPGGLLAINTPDGTSLLAKLLKARWHLVVPPEHLFFFGPRNFQKLIEPIGFEVLTTKKIGKKFTIPYIFQTIGNGRHSKFLKRIATWTERSPLKHFGIPINLYDNFFLIARKKPEKA